ncbi:alpha/beta hydrolase [Leptothrix discophora]|uniref:Alpha/beta fold hydrolase n=1 Tax=Leptothrix discophora TaxID=89 RepID=A0ABT9G6S8_LEPDI|nr:alpha/beta fold hydrolase [Leptothrix discophora]MDP4302182.1 alpha/beta fold hydrolase [Leptothrix discophora]
MNTIHTLRPDMTDTTAPVEKPAPRRRRWKAVLMGLTLLPALAWALACLAVWLGQERLLFKPVVTPASQPLSTAPDVSERFVDVPGARLSVLELRRPDPAGVVFFLHGNSGNLQEWFVNTEVYRRTNMDLVMMDYRGYGKSSGHIGSEAQLHADVQAVWQSVAERYRGRRVVVYGRSLGSALAATLAAQLQPDLTVLVSPYSSMAALARLHYPWVPASLLRYPLRTDEAVARLRTPLLLVHGERDVLIPPSHSLALQALAPSARHVDIAGAGHGDVHEFDDYRRLMAQALDGRVR